MIIKNQALVNNLTQSTNKAEKAKNVNPLSAHFLFYLGVKRIQFPKTKQSLMKRFHLILLILITTLGIFPTSAEAAATDYDKQLDAAYEAEKKGQFQGAIDILEPLLHTVPKDSATLLSDILSTLANDYYRLGQMDKALEYGEQCLSNDEKSGNEENLSSSLNNLAAICSTIGRHEQAEQYLKRCIKIEERLGRNDKLAIRLGMLCEVYTLQNRLKEALPLAQRALELDKKDGREEKMAVRMSQLGNTLAHLKRYKEAVPYLKDASQLLAKHENYSSLCLNNLALGEALHAMGNIPEAEAALKATVSTAQKIHQRHTLMTAYMELARLSHDKHNDAEAYQYQKLFIELKDSISTEQVHKQISDLQVRYESAQDKLQLAEQQATIQRTRILVGAACILLLMLMIALAVVFHSLNVKKRMLALRDQLMRIVSHDLKNPALASQRNLHMMLDHYDQLSPSDIREELTHMAESSDAQVDLLYNLLTWAQLNSKRLQLRPLQLDLNSVIEKVVALHQQQAAVKDIRIVAVKSAEPVIVTADHPTVSTIVRNLLSNAIKFSNSGSEIIVTADASSIIVEDHGVGMDTEGTHTVGTAGEGGTGLGMQLVESLARLNNARVSIESHKGKGTKVKISF